MKQNFNGEERDADDWVEFVRKADPNFRLLQINPWVNAFYH
jgi:hypothetical protein